MGCSGKTSSTHKAALSALAPASLYLLRPCSRQPSALHSQGTKSSGAILNSRRLARRAEGRTPGVKATAFTAEGDPMLGMAALTTYPQETVFETATFQVRLERTLNILR